MTTTRSDRIVKRTACPACGAAKGFRCCTTTANGLDTGWSHDARIYADTGWRNPDAALRFAVAFCDADTTWEHHDQTDNHPCTRCKRYGEVATHLAAPVPHPAATDPSEGGGGRG